MVPPLLAIGYLQTGLAVGASICSFCLATGSLTG